MATIVDVQDDYGYDLFQQYYCLNAAANAVGKKKGTPAYLQGRLQEALIKLLPTLSGAWNLTWGPAVYKKNPGGDTGPDNAWFVAVDDVQKQCVVAVAGTSVTSFQGWMGDMDVTKLVDFQSWTNQWTASGAPYPTAVPYDASKSLCSNGTAVFVANIINSQAPNNARSPGTRIGEYLKGFQAKNPGYTIVFTGHSLGGAVSPALALGIAKRILPQGAKVKALPSAGASPGNKVFNADYTQYFPAGSGYNTNFYNTLDIVPQAWSAERSDDRNLHNIDEKIYAKASEATRAFVEKQVQDALKRPGMPYVPLPGTSFTGVPGIEVGLPLFRLLSTILYQHVDAYWNQLKIQKFVDAIKNVLGVQMGLEDVDLVDPEAPVDDNEETPAPADA